MTITSATTATTPAATSASAATGNPLASLGPNAFLQLMIAQLQNQNPLSASQSDPTQFMTELTQMTAVEQQTNTAQSTAQAAALSLLGRTVTYADSSGASQTGTVQKVDLTGVNGPTLTIGASSGITLGAVSEVS